MFRVSMKSLIALPAMASVLLLTACQASGGGTLPSAGSCSVGAQTGATFGFNAFQVPNSNDITFAGNLTDRCAGVMLKSSGKMTPIAPPDFARDYMPGGAQFNVCLIGTATYDSVNPSKPGSGTMNLVVCDGNSLGATPSGGDLVMISMPPNSLAFLFPGLADAIDTGPYSDYSNAGILTVGQGRTPGIGLGNVVVRQ
jgi:hypothetical protein